MDIVLSLGITVDGVRLSKDVTVTAENFTRTEVSVADGQTAFRVNLAIDVSQLEALYIVSDQAVTIETNDSTTPDDTLVLEANEPLEWYRGPTVDAADRNPLAVDVTDFYIANASGAAATVKIWVGQNATP